MSCTTIQQKAFWLDSYTAAQFVTGERRERKRSPVVQVYISLM